MLNFRFCLFLITYGKLLHAQPNQNEQDSSQKNIVANATNILTYFVLQLNEIHDRSYVFSPLTHVTSSAILSEGANGDTLLEFSSWLFDRPDHVDLGQVRFAYKSYLKSLEADNTANPLLFKAFLSVYGNTTVEEKFKNSIRDNYFVEMMKYNDQSKNDDLKLIEKYKNYSMNRSPLVVNLKTNLSCESESCETESKMLLSTMLVFKGNWAIPFQISSDSDNFFYKSTTEKARVKMMKARGFLKIADCEHLKAKAIDIPYKNKRYSLMVLLPNTRDGLHSLIETLSFTSIPETISQLEGKFIDISIPSFGFKSYARNLFQTEWMSLYNPILYTPIFDFQSSKANFGGISTEERLHIGKLEQFNEINFFDDESSNSENSENVSAARNAQPEESIIVDRPFLFFLRDVEDGVIIMAGRIKRFPLDPLEDFLRERAFNKRSNTYKDKDKY